MEQDLAETFADLALRLGASRSLSRRWTSEFLARYTEPQRHYHTLSHIAAMLACLDSRQAVAHDADAMALSIFFHDWIYEPANADNELQSIKVFTQFANDIDIESHLREKVNKFIECTISHTLPKLDVLEEADLSLFLDADLEVLSRPPDEYNLYAQQIRKEYAHYPSSDYRKGRAKVLRGFLERERIYYSSYFASSEAAARRNIASETVRLERGEMP